MPPLFQSVQTTVGLNSKLDFSHFKVDLAHVFDQEGLELVRENFYPRRLIGSASWSLKWRRLAKHSCTENFYRCFA